MKKPFKIIMAYIMGIFSIGLGLVIIVQIINVIDIRMLKAGYLEFGGLSQFSRVYLGIPLFIFMIIAWIGLVIFCFDYYRKGIKNNTLFRNFSLVTAVELFIVPVVVFLYQLVFPMQMTRIDWLIVGIGLFSGSLFFFLYRYQINN